MTQRSDFEDVFKLPLERMPSIVTEIIAEMDPERRRQIKQDLDLEESSKKSSEDEEDLDEIGNRF